MRKIISLLAFLCASLAQAQTNPVIDSLEKTAHAQRDTDQIHSYNELTWQYRNVDQEKAIQYGNKAITLSKQLRFNKGLAQAYNDLGIIYFDRQAFDTALNYYQQAFAIRKAQNDMLGMAKLYNKIGIVYQQEGAFAKGLEAQQAALTLFEKEKNDIGISYSLNNIGIICQNMGRYDDAIRYQEQSIAIKEKIGDRYGLAGSYVNVGNIYLLNKVFDKAKEYYLKGVSICREIGDKEYLATALNSLGRFYITVENYNSAIPIVQESFSLRNGMGDKKGMVKSLDNLAETFINLKLYDSAQNTLNQALLIAKDEVSCKPELPGLFKTYSSLYEGLEKYDSSLYFHKLYSDFKDSLFNADLSEKFAALQTKYETLKKEQQIAQQQFQLTKKNYWIGGSLGLLVLASLLGFSYHRRRELKQEAKLHAEVLRQQELATKAVLEAEEAERQRIAKDLHDGVGQMMSAAKMNLSAYEHAVNFDSEEAKESFGKIISLVDDSCKEVRAVSHNMMPNALLKNSLAAAIREFIDKLDHKALKVHLYTEGLDERLDSNTETVLYRVIQECVNNVIKHSGANVLDISIAKDAREITATVEDNGQGFDIAGSHQEGIGLKNIRTRVEYLKGTVDFDSTPGRGTLVAIHVPIS
ncbi:MAG: tetratricopeptide repeat protein [Flaviaesturariibacter sp.]|nr:tetratricopeptide repeat protein [Flaviaesturariibacter sp.]